MPLHRDEAPAIRRRSSFRYNDIASGSGSFLLGGVLNLWLGHGITAPQAGRAAKAMRKPTLLAELSADKPIRAAIR